MSSIGTFGSFTTARLGIYTSQQGLNVTGNNISNINTIGYTRQTLDQVSLRTSGADRYASGNLKIGNGAIAHSVSQLRDPYLDIRYRAESAAVGATDTKLAGLNDLATILDEIGDGDDENGVIAAQLTDLMDMLQNLSESTGQKEADTLVRTSAESLVKLFNSYSSKLDQFYNNTITGFEQDIEDVNEILTSIRDLNEEIRKSEIHGDKALELRDERNNLIDELSYYMDIDVIYSEEYIGAGLTVEKLSIKLSNANPDPTVETDSSTLIDGVYARQLSIPTVENPDGTTSYNENFDILLSKLLDSEGREWVNYGKTTTAPIAGTDAFISLLNNAKGTISWTTDTHSYEITSQAGQNGTEYTITATSLADGTVTTATAADISEFIDMGVALPSPVTITSDDGSLVTTYTLNEVTDDTGATSYTLSTKRTEYTLEVSLDDNDLYGSLQASRELLTESGEFASETYINTVDENAATKRGIPYYQRALDALANKIATVFNEANSGYMTDENGNYLHEDGGTITVAGQALNRYNITDEQKQKIIDFGTVTEDGEADISAYLARAGAIPAENSGNLFSNNGSGNDAEGITASNISVSYAWANGEVQLVSSYEIPTGFDEVSSTDNSNILHFIAQMESSFEYVPSDIVPGASDIPMFKGDFYEMLTNISSVLGNDQRSTETMLNTHYTTATDIDTGRDSVSSVDLNDEAMNLVQYQNAYSAACRFLTSLDETLDKLINGTGRAGL